MAGEYNGQWTADRGQQIAVFLKHLSLTNYRNYARLELDLPEQVILVQGDNAQGKTNLLEAIYYLATTRSPLVGSDRHLLSWAVAGEPMAFARIVGDVERTAGPARIEITLVREASPGAVAGEPRLGRRFRLNGVDKRAIDLLGQLNVVLFLPQDIDLVAGPPALRRRYLDVTLCQVDAAYCRHLQQYNRVLVQRNSLLRRLRERRDDPAQLRYWDEQLARWGAQVVQRRKEALRWLESAAAGIHRELSGGMEALALRYEASVSLPSGDGQALSPSDAMLASLERAHPRDMGAGVSTVGPHRDEVRFLANGVDMGLLGSRGQQRTVALALKLAEVRFMAEETGEVPVLLLDDVMSELDRVRGGYVLGAVAAARQVIITATDVAPYPADFLQRAALWQVRQGAIMPAEP